MAQGIEIVSQQQVKAPDLSGAYVDAVRVSFRVDNEGPFSVEVPVTKYSAAEVDRLTSTYAEHVRQVAKLGQ